MEIKEFNLKSLREIPIFFACDEGFVKYTMVSIKSIMENASRDRRYHIYTTHGNFGGNAEPRDGNGGC